MTILTRAWSVFHPSQPPKSDSPIRFGILGAAAIAPIALILPARNCPDAVVTVVGARSLERAKAYAKKHGIPRAVEGYDAVLDDPEVDAVYNPLPNGLHYEWTMKALLKGKHVLLEKPATDTAEECERIFALAKRKNLVVLEAFHYRFHPAIQRLKAILESGELGELKAIKATLAVPRGFIPPNDIRFDLSLGGGAGMDMGCYVTSVSRFIAGREPTEVREAKAVIENPEKEPKVDRRMEFTYVFPPAAGQAEPVPAECTCDLGLPGWGPFGLIPSFVDATVTVTCTQGTASLRNFVAPVFLHWLTIKGPKGSRTERAYTWGKEGKEKGWKGEYGWSTYRFQLEAFVDKLKGRAPQHWIEGEESVANMRCLEMIYEKSGLGVRPASSFKIPDEEAAGGA